MKKLALFDFDGTITSRDTLLAFIEFTSGKFTTYIGLIFLSPILIAHKMGIIANYRAKEMVMRYFWMGRDIEDFQNMGVQFCERKLPKLIRNGAWSKIKYYLDNNWKVVIVSASSGIWITEWAEGTGVSLISTELEVLNGQITGRIKGKNCHGVEKVNRIKQSFNLKEYETIHAYGDSRGDLPMLNLAKESFYKPFRN